MIPEAPTEVAVIDDSHDLAGLVDRLRRHDWVALDTEFVRERTYYPRLCLIQLAGPDELACVDPLALDTLEPLTAILSDRQVTKVLHAATQDLEVLLQASGTMPAPIFDTQVAAALLGHPDQIGYARLVAAILDVELDKAHARTDWSQRPLDTQQVDYAADDVRYLAELYPHLRDQLTTRGRLEWLHAESESMVDPARYTPAPAHAWQRVKGVHKLRPQQQQMAARLAEWRETTAIERDRPRRWILKDDALVQLARKRPGNKAELARIRDLPESVIRRHGDALLDCVRAAGQAPAEALVAEPAVLSPEQQPLVDLLMAALRARAATVDISVGALASRKQLEQLAGGERDLPITRGWRLAAAGQTLLDLLDGRITLHATTTGVELQQTDTA